MRRPENAAGAVGRHFARLLALSSLLLSATTVLPAEPAAGQPTVPSNLAQVVEGNGRVTDIKTSGAVTQSENTSDYRLDTGDRVSIVVYREPDLSVTGVRVKGNGTISYPLLGDLHVSGLTSEQVHDVVMQRLMDGYLKKPHVTVSIDSYRLYFIHGEVKRPGGYSFVDGLTVAKAVALAGGYTVRASEKSISLLRETDPNNPLESVDPNTAIRPGDIVTVGESFF